MSEWLGSASISDGLMANWALLLMFGVTAAFLTWCKAIERRDPVRRGALVEFQTAAVVARYRRGEVGKDETLAEMERLRTKPRFRD